MAKTKTKRRRKSRRKKKRVPDIKIDQILLRRRQVFLFDVIKEDTIRNLIREIIALDNISPNPIILYINSPGGSVDDGFALIDTMRGIRSPIITVIIGQSCSMAGIISIAGDKRLISKHSVWMAHDMAGGIGGDYTTKVIDRTEFLKREQKKLNDFLRKNTKLSEAEVVRATHGELWFYPEECLKKGIVDEVIGDEK